jgi:NADPH-dependent curcumin reductase CurA
MPNHEKMREAKLILACKAGARAVDIAGGQETCTSLLDEHGFDAIDHRA